MKPNDDIDFNPAMSEIDNHADTHVFGKNFRPIYFTSEVCSVTPFLDEYKEQENVRICTGATAYETKFGETIILQFGQALWFGNRMEKSLINPNQCRAYGIMSLRGKARNRPRDLTVIVVGVEKNRYL